MAEPVWFQNILDKLEKPRRSGKGYSALCPAHPDSEPSMSATIGDNGSAILNCHRGCTKTDIVHALGMEMKDLWPPETRNQTATKSGKKEWVANYDYTDAEGNLLFQVTRWKKPDGGKTFTQRRPLGNGQWEYSTTSVNKPLYRLPKVNAAIKAGDPIYIAEGEKDVHTLESFGLTATCNSGGADAWMSKYSEALRGAEKVFILVDNDPVGYKHGAYVLEELEGLDIDAEILAAPEPHKDVTDLIENGGDLSELVTPEITAESMDQYQELVRDVKDIASKEWTIEKKVARTRSLLDAAEFEGVDNGRLVRWDEFLREPVEAYDWIIPDLIERQDRTIVVAGEGAGKTMLARQIALMTAMGTHPFTLAKMKPIRTLFVDLENPQRIIRRTSKKIMEETMRLRPAMSIPAHLYSKPDGVNLLNKDDRVILETKIQQTEPDLVCIGPIYKMYIDPGGRTAESVTTEVAMFLDYLRSTYNCALWLEHHAPHGTSDSSRHLRPIGSSVWQRWPEFGIALTPDPTVPYRYDLKHFRGAREERDFPIALRRGQNFPFDPEWS